MSGAWAPTCRHGGKTHLGHFRKMVQQLALEISIKESFTFDRLMPGENSQLLEDSKACACGTGEQFVYIWGSTATGKSHLLQALAQMADDQGRPSAYIPLDQATEFEPDILLGLEDLTLVCLDNLQHIAGHKAWERALFNLFNNIREKQNYLITSAIAPPVELGIDLNDLTSRLTWGLTHHLKPLNDQQKQACIIEDAARRGLIMSPDTAAFIMRYYPRDMSSLRQLLDHLDTASLEDQRRLTIPFIKQRLVKP